MPMKPKSGSSLAPKKSMRPKSGDDARAQAALDRAEKAAGRERADYMERSTAPKKSPRPKKNPR